MIVVLDTNVFLEKRNLSCWVVLNLLLNSYPEYVQLGLDAEGKIEAEYEQYKEKMTEESQELLQKLLDRVTDFSTKFAPRLGSSYQENQVIKLQDFGCHRPIQPSLLSLTLHSTNPTLIYVDNTSGAIQRQYYDTSILAELRREQLIGNCLPAEEAARLLTHHKERFPTTREELELLLDKYKVCGIREEHSFLECKGPQSTLTQTMSKQIAKAVCAMLNTCNGWVLIGIRDSDKEIVGFEPRYESGTKSGFEHIQPIINQEINRIKPRPAGRFEPWVIDLKNGKIIVVISVLKGKEGTNYCYDFDKGPKVYIRQGPESVESARDCTES